MAGKNALDAKNLLLKGSQESRTTCPPSYVAMAEGRRGTSKMSRHLLSYVIFISVRISHYFYINFFHPLI